jgi:hypothetical protein
LAHVNQIFSTDKPPESSGLFFFPFKFFHNSKVNNHDFLQISLQKIVFLLNVLSSLFCSFNSDRLLFFVSLDTCHLQHKPFKRNLEEEYCVIFLLKKIMFLLLPGPHHYFSSCCKMLSVILIISSIKLGRGKRKKIKLLHIILLISCSNSRFD